MKKNPFVNQTWSCPRRPERERVVWREEIEKDRALISFYYIIFTWFVHHMGYIETTEEKIMRRKGKSLSSVYWWLLAALSSDTVMYCINKIAFYLIFNCEEKTTPFVFLQKFQLALKGQCHDNLRVFSSMIS